MSLKGEDLFEAFGGVDEIRLAHSERKGVFQSRAVWIGWGALAACFTLLLLIVIAFPALFPEDGNQSVSNRDTLGNQETMLADQDDTEMRPEGGAAAGEEQLAQSAAEKDQAENADGTGYGFSMNGAVYVPVTSEACEAIERYGLGENMDNSMVQDSADATVGEDKFDGQEFETEELTGYESVFRQPTEADLGEEMGILQDCGDESLNGSKVYYYAAFPEDASICIVEHDGEYAFYCRSLTEIP